MRLGSPVITIVQCSICSQLNNTHTPLIEKWSQILGCTIPRVATIYGFTKWWLLEAYLHRNLHTHIQHMLIIICVCANTPT